MKRITVKLMFFILLFALISSALSPASGVSPTVGISDGDSFKFDVEYSSTDDLGDGAYVSYDSGTYEDIYAQDGDTVTVSYPDATPYKDIWGEWVVDYVLTLNGDTYEGSDELIDGGTWTSTTDWDAQKTVLEANIADFDAEIAADSELSGSFSIIDTSDEFGVKYSYSYDGEEDGVSIQSSELGETRLDKTTGVVLYVTWTSKLKSSGSAVTVDFKETAVVTRDGYSPPGGDDAGLLPGFEFANILAAFSIMLIPIILKRRK